MLEEVGDGAWAYVQGDGGWGWSNAGLVVDGERSLLVDTLFDLRLTAEMLESMRRATQAAEHIDVLVNTHANGDHCYGNELVGGAEIVASRRSAEEMAEIPPDVLAGFVASAPNLGVLGEYVATIFGGFGFDGIRVVPPTRTFDGDLTLHVGDRVVHLMELGPAHTTGDVIAHIPDADVVFTGDLLFHGAHPVVWAGPIGNWIAACDRILALEPVVVVPGHGPVADRSTVEAQRGYFEWLVAEGTPRLEAGMTPIDAARDLADGPYADWGEGERLVANLVALARELHRCPDDGLLDVFGQMAELWLERTGGRQPS